MVYTAALAALMELWLARIGVPALYDKLSEGALLGFLSWATFFRNLLGISGLAALALMIGMWVSDKHVATLTRRLSLAVFGLVMIVLSVSLLVFPEEWVMPYERMKHGVLSVSVAAHALVVNLGFAVVSKRISASRRATLWLFAVSSVCALGILALAWMPLAIQLHAAVLLRQALLRMGETVYLVGVGLAAFVAFPRGRSTRDAVAMMVISIVTVVVSTLCVSLHTSLGGGYAQMWYGAFRLEWLLDYHPLLYVPVIAIGIAVSLGAMLTSSHVQRMSGAALGLLIAAGFAPPAVDRLTMWVLGVITLAVYAAPDSQRNANEAGERPELQTSSATAA